MIGGHRKNWTSINGSGGQDAFFAGGGLIGRLGHENNIKHGAGSLTSDLRPQTSDLRPQTLGTDPGVLEKKGRMSEV
jgi:hypothetical protein